MDGLHARCALGAAVDARREVRSTGRPLYITTNGETDAVVLNPATFDELAEKAELAESLAMLDRSMEDIRDGRTRPAKTAIREIAEKLGLAEAETSASSDTMRSSSRRDGIS